MEQKVKIVFVILHYMAIEDTKECIKSIIEHTKEEETHIVVVDNNSPDGSGKILEALYNENAKITVICNNENLGFAKGNNIGYAYAKKVLKPQYIVLCNNDILLLEDGILSKLDEEYAKSEFALLGPLVLTRDGYYTSNPSRIAPIDKNEVRELLRYYENCLVANRFHVLPFYYLYRKIFYRKKKIMSESYKKQYGVSLHGCFMVFSEKYIDVMDGLNSETYMYGEEEILYKMIQKNNMVSVYTPEIIIYHKEDVSTDTIYKSKRKKKDFYYSNLVQSTKVLLGLYDEE